MSQLIKYLLELAERRKSNLITKSNRYCSKHLTAHEFFLFIFPFLLVEENASQFFDKYSICNDLLILEEIKSVCFTSGRIESLILGICGVQINDADKVSIVNKLLTTLNYCNSIK